MNTIANGFKDDYLDMHDGVELAKLIAKGRISAREVVESAIERARETNPRINAIAHETFINAQKEIYKRSGPFFGVPIFIKDNEDMEGSPTLHGSSATPRLPVSQSSECVRIRGETEAGAPAPPSLSRRRTTEPASSLTERGSLPFSTRMT